MVVRRPRAAPGEASAIRAGQGPPHTASGSITGAPAAPHRPSAISGCHSSRRRDRDRKRSAAARAGLASHCNLRSASSCRARPARRESSTWRPAPDRVARRPAARRARPAAQRLLHTARRRRGLPHTWPAPCRLLRTLTTVVMQPFGRCSAGFMPRITVGIARSQVRPTGDGRGNGAFAVRPLSTGTCLGDYEGDTLDEAAYWQRYPSGVVCAKPPMV